ncbi:uncharacterized protein LOC129592533 [Paramacrobiotus metropolitanus]|uniref:uncharacterized protein LOC129592533 n=1 Tax=Paramacrobiotus metropolitanus TaxID=2943436 RepID=UPI00244635B8|nr:uncharacterized protein LOC129592533 [Paramacrobiotus metropolitanus]
MDSKIFPDITTSHIRIINLEHWAWWASHFHGRIHKALRTDTGEVVVVKTINVNGKDAASWKDEDEICSRQLDTLKSNFDWITRLRHPNLLRHMHYQEQMKGQQRLYRFEIFIELFGRDTLHDTACSVELTPLQTQHMMRQVVDGLAYLHEHRCAHRDLRGCNILVAPTRTGTYLVKIAGLGNIKDVTHKWSYRRDYSYYRFFAPERFSDTPPQYQPPGLASRRSFCLDVWSLGCVVLEVVNRGWPEFYVTGDQGQRVKKATNLFGIMCVIITQEGSPHIPDALPETVRSFVKSCLEREPTNRPLVTDLKGHEFLIAPQDVVAKWVLPRSVTEHDFVQ